MRSPRVALIALLVTPIAVPAADDARPSSPEQRLAFAKAAAGAYRFRLSGRGRAEVALAPEPLLRWNNTVIREDDGMLFLWTEGRQGRPVAAAQFFLQEDAWHHEFQSLTPDRFEVRWEGGGPAPWSWQPARPGLSFTRAEDASPPAATANARLRQMKAVAERFTAAVDQDGTFENPEQLRLLTTPIYRYAAPDAGVLDGALFAFTQGTNPEVLLRIEAESNPPAWRLGFARMSCFHLRVSRGGRPAWSAGREPVPTTDPGSPYHFRFRAQADRSSADRPE